MEKGLLIILSGPSGAGKGTILNGAKKSGLGFALSISVTTRKPRENEIDGINYFFKSKEEVCLMRANNEFLEVKDVYDHMYGTSRKFVEDNLNAGRDVVLEIDTQGALEVKSKMPDAVMIFVVPENLETLRARLIGRGTETLEQVNKRFGQAMTEINSAEKYDYLLINDNLDKCISEFIAIITAEKRKINRNMNMIKSFQ